MLLIKCVILEKLFVVILEKGLVVLMVILDDLLGYGCMFCENGKLVGIIE